MKAHARKRAGLARAIVNDPELLFCDEPSAGLDPVTSRSLDDLLLELRETLGITMKVTRKSLKQAGDALEQAVRRDMGSAIEAALDKAIFLGTGANGQPSGVLVGSYSITSTNVAADASWAAFRGAVARFMTNNAASGPGDVRLLLRPEIWSFMDGTLITGTAVSEWDRLVKNIPNPVMSSNALAAASLSILGLP